MIKKILLLVMTSFITLISCEKEESDCSYKNKFSYTDEFGITTNDNKFSVWIPCGDRWLGSWYNGIYVDLDQAKDFVANSYSPSFKAVRVGNDFSPIEIDKRYNENKNTKENKEVIEEFCNDPEYIVSSVVGCVAEKEILDKIFQNNIFDSSIKGKLTYDVSVGCSFDKDKLFECEEYTWRAKNYDLSKSGIQNYLSSGLFKSERIFYKFEQNKGGIKDNGIEVSLNLWYDYIGGNLTKIEKFSSIAACEREIFVNVLKDPTERVILLFVRVYKYSESNPSFVYNFTKEFNN